MTTHTPEKLREEFSPEQVRKTLNEYSECWCIPDVDGPAPEGSLRIMNMLEAYANLIERIGADEGAVTKEVVLVARRAYAGRETIDSSDHLLNSWMRAALLAVWPIQPAQAGEVPCSFSEALNVIENWAGHGNILKLPNDVMRFRALADRIAPTPAHESFERGTGDAVPVAAVIRHDGNGYGRRERAVLLSQYDPRKPSFWSGGKMPENYSFDLCYIHPPAQVAQTVDIEVIKDVIRGLKGINYTIWADKLAQAIGDKT